MGHTAGAYCQQLGGPVHVSADASDSPVACQTVELIRKPFRHGLCHAQIAGHLVQADGYDQPIG